MASGWVKYGDEVPPGIRAVVEWAVPVLALESWRIWVSLKDEIERDETNAGVCHSDLRSRIARIELKRDVVDDGTDVSRLVLHELMHAVFAPFDLAVQERIKTLVSDEVKEHAMDLYRDALEQVTNEGAGAFRRFVPLERGGRVVEFIGGVLVGVGLTIIAGVIALVWLADRGKWWPV